MSYIVVHLASMDHRFLFVILFFTFVSLLEESANIVIVSGCIDSTVFVCYNLNVA